MSYDEMNRCSNRKPEPQPMAMSRRAEGAPAARRDGLPIWLLALAGAVVLAWTCVLLFRGTIAFAGQPSPDDLRALAPTSRATDSNTAPAPATITATLTATPTLTPLSPATPTSFPAGPTLSPTPSPTATDSQGVESTAMPLVVRQAPLPTPTLPPPLPTDVPVAGEPHGDYGVTTSSCAGCHRAHSAGGLALRKTWPEETLCFSCHGAAGPGTDVEAAFAATANTATRIFKHDVAATTGVHHIGETAGSDFGGANRHVEC
ncbi:MAG: cytochrome c3 family protein, partial [Anaerolineae bacterium]